MEVLLGISVLMIFLLVVSGAVFAIAKSLFSPKSRRIQTNKPTALPLEIADTIEPSEERLYKENSYQNNHLRAKNQSSKFKSGFPQLSNTKGKKITQKP